MKTAFLDSFAGPIEIGSFSPSAQKTLYDTQLKTFGLVPQVNAVCFHLLRKKLCMMLT